MPSKLIEAVRTGNLTLARAKLEAGRNPNQLDEHKNPLIHYPIIQDNPEMLQLLLEYGADPNLRWKKDIVIQKEFTPLHVVTTVRAADKKHRKTILDLLLAYGANPAAVDSDGRTALNVARNKTAKKYLKKLAGSPKKNKTAKKNELITINNRIINTTRKNQNNNMNSITKLILQNIRNPRESSPLSQENEVEYNPTLNKIITIKNVKRGTKKVTG